MFQIEIQGVYHKSESIKPFIKKYTIAVSLIITFFWLLSSIAQTQSFKQDNNL